VQSKDSGIRLEERRIYKGIVIPCLQRMSMSWSWSETRDHCPERDVCLPGANPGACHFNG